jgi:hypothetical protein
MQIAYLVLTALGTLFSGISAAHILGLDVRIFGRRNVTIDGTQMATSFPRGFLWLLLAMSLVGFLFATIDLSLRLFNKENTSTGIEIVSQTHFRPADLKFGSGLRITLATDTERAEAVQIFVICDGPIGLAPDAGESSKTGKFSVESQMLIASHAEIWNVKWRPEHWATDEKLTFELLSKQPVQAKWVFPVRYNPNANPNVP